MKKINVSDVAFWVFFATLGTILVARVFTVHYGVNWLLDSLSECYDFIYSLISYGALLMLIFSFGVSIQTSQRLKDDEEYHIKQECNKVLKKARIEDLEWLL